MGDSFDEPNLADGIERAVLAAIGRDQPLVIAGLRPVDAFREVIFINPIPDGVNHIRLYLENLKEPLPNRFQFSLIITIIRFLEQVDVELSGLIRDLGRDKTS